RYKAVHGETMCSFIVLFSFTEFLDPFQRVIQPEEIWLYKNPLVESDNIPTRLMFAISFLTPLAVIFVVKIIRRTDKTEIKEAFLAVSLALALNGVCTNTIKLIVGRPRPDFFYRCFPDGDMKSNMDCTGDPDVLHIFLCKLVFWQFCNFLPFRNYFLANIVLLSLPHLDAFVGGVIGLMFAYICYRQHYPPLGNLSCHKPYVSLLAQTVLKKEEAPTVDNATSLPLEGITEGPV
uniref:Phospholipid phosphatase 4 n=1 Tax=Podarcis muralis TaxID=64176 RepID=A0A670IDC2_PODMU